MGAEEPPGKAPRLCPLLNLRLRLPEFHDQPRNLINAEKSVSLQLTLELRCWSPVIKYTKGQNKSAQRTVPIWNPEGTCLEEEWESPRLEPRTPAETRNQRQQCVLELHRIHGNTCETPWGGVHCLTCKISIMSMWGKSQGTQGTCTVVEVSVCLSSLLAEVRDLNA
jgi:hypothetical protein